MADEFDDGGDDALPGTGPEPSTTDSGSLGDLTSELRSTITGADDSPVADVNMDPSQPPFGQQQYPNNAPSGREGQVDAGGGFVPPPASPAGMPLTGVRELLQSFGMHTHHYPDDRAALDDLLTQAYQSQQQAAQAARQVEALQEYARQMQQQMQVQTQAPQAAPAAPTRPQWNPAYADIAVIDGENGEKRYVSKSTGLAVAPETVQQAIQFQQSKEEFLRDLYERPEEAMKPIVSEAVQQAMSQFQQYQAQQQRQQEYQSNLNQANDYVVRNFGSSLFNPGPYGPNLAQPTPLGYQFLQIVESMPPQLSPMDKVRFAQNQLAMNIMSSNPAMFTNGAPPVNGQHQFFPQQAQAPQQTPGDRQRQALRRTAYRNPSVSSPSASGTAEDFLTDPSIDIREKLRRAMVGVN